MGKPLLSMAEWGLRADDYRSTTISSTSGAPGLLYRWLNRNSLACNRGARQIWVFNVGNIKPQGLPLTFAMAVAWDIDSTPSPAAVPRFFEAYAQREFGSHRAAEIGSLLMRHDGLMARAVPGHDRGVDVRPATAQLEPDRGPDGRRGRRPRRGPTRPVTLLVARCLE